MSTIIQSVRGYICIGLGFAACPCHLPITLPLVLSLTAGTVLGAWLATNTPLVYALSTVLFFGWLTLGFTWLNTGSKRQVQVDSERQQKNTGPEKSKRQV